MTRLHWKTGLRCQGQLLQQQQGRACMTYLDFYLVSFFHLLHLSVLVAQLSLAVIELLLGNLPEGIDFVLWAHHAAA